MRASKAATATRESDTAPTPGHSKLLEALGHDAVGIDNLAERTGLAIPVLSSMLLELELDGEVAVERGGAYVRRNRRA